MTENILASLEPKIVWSIFEEITKVPRQSKKEEKIRKWIKDWATKNKIEIKNEDNVGNILLYKKAKKGFEKYPTLILQAHMDMVCQKTKDLNINFDTDPLSVKIEKDKVLAVGTSLGADNGIGMALCLSALITEDLNHGPLEVLFTVDEETGLTGASSLKPKFFTGKYLLNLDSDIIGIITISSAGGGGTEIVLPIKFSEKKNHKGIKLAVSGLQGGHSGADIDLPRLNAIKVGIDALLDLKDIILLNSISGGSVRNAIPRDFECTFLIPDERYNEIMKKLNQWRQTTLKIAKASEPKIKIDIDEEDEKNAVTTDQTKAILNILSEIKHGPYSYSQEISGLVQTSSNLATVKTIEKQFEIHVSTRSSDAKELEVVRKEIGVVAKSNNAKVTMSEAYPGWKPDLNSPFLKLVKNCYEETIGKKVELKAVHAGLECGYFKALNPELQISSIGPNICNAHSPSEYIEIKSVKTLWEIVRMIIEKMNSL